nr:phospholipase D-like domain-containing protein [Caldimonas sp.]
MAFASKPRPASLAVTLDIFFDRYLLTVHGIVVALGLIVYVGVARALPQRRDPPAAIAWVVALALLPYVALPLYLMFGSRKLRMRDATAPALPPVEGDADDAESSLWSRRLGRSMGLAPAVPYADLRIHADGAEAKAAALELIRGARATLDVCTFILARDPLGEEIAAALRERAAAGVKVRLLIDGIGAWLGGRVDFEPLRSAGVAVVMFVPPFRSILRGRANLRNHRKMVIADGERLWCGGRNFAAEYFEGDPALRNTRSIRGRAWHDLTFDLRGPIAEQALDHFDKDWAYASRVPAPPRAESGLDAAPAPRRGPLAQLVPSGPEQVDDTVQALLVSGCFMARRCILIVTPYFIPDATLLMALTLAARRGVAVDLLMPSRSNHVLADIARHRPLRDLAAAGARLWFAPHMLHAKAVVIDDEVALAGSANLDARSLFLNYELMVAFYEPVDVRRFAAWIGGEKSLASPFHPREPGLVRDLAEGLVLWLAFQL